MPGKYYRCHAVLLMLCLVLQGCSGQFLFRHLDWIVRDYVSDYVSLTDAQEEQLDKEVHQLQQWLVDHAIVKYRDFFDQLMQLAPHEMTREKMTGLSQQLQAFYRELQQQVTPAITRLAATLSDQQVQELLTALRQQHQDSRKKYSGSEQEKREKITDIFEENLEKWLGDLTPNQKNTLNFWVSRRSMNTQAWLDWQTAVEQQFQSLMALRHQSGAFSARLNDLLINTESYYPSGFRLQVAQNRQMRKTYLLQIIRQMTPEQTKHFRHEVEHWKKIAIDIQLSMSSPGGS